jgi:hypothetical protein
VVYQAGFATTPGDLVGICALLAKHFMGDRRVPLNQASQVVGGLSETRAGPDQRIPLQLRQSLDAYVAWASRAG